MQENTTLLNDKISQMQSNVDRAAASSHTLDVLVAGWPDDQSHIQKSRDKLFARWRSLLVACQLNFEPLKRLRSTIAKSNLFVTTIPVHPDVVRAQAYISMLSAWATFLQILVFVIRVVIIIFAVIVIGGLTWGLILLIKFLFEQFLYFITQVLPGIIP